MNTKDKPNFFPPLHSYIEDLLQEPDLISEDRRKTLMALAQYVQKKIQEEQAIRLNFICTHNSRRSHISQIWAACASAFYGLENVHTYSGGTEATAFHPNAVESMERAGFGIEKPGGDNPHYQVSFASDHEPLECFSKTFDDPYNPSANFAAIMTCSQADENCPFVPGTEMRLSLTYEDPKAGDGTPKEQAVYDERVKQIGREIFYAFSQVEIHE